MTASRLVRRSERRRIPWLDSFPAVEEKKTVGFVFSKSDFRGPDSTAPAGAVSALYGALVRSWEQVERKPGLLHEVGAVLLGVEAVQVVGQLQIEAIGLVGVGRQAACGDDIL